MAIPGLHKDSDADKTEGGGDSHSCLPPTPAPVPAETQSIFSAMDADREPQGLLFRLLSDSLWTGVEHWRRKKSIPTTSSSLHYATS